MQEKNKRYTGINRLLKINSLQVLLDKMAGGTFEEFIGDWRWIFSFSKRYRGVVIFYTLLGLFGSTLSLTASYVSKILINIIVGRQTDRLWFLISVTIFSTIFSLVTNSVLSRIGLKISIRVNNDIQSEIFGKIIDADWKALNRYPGGDLLNRFSRDTGTVAYNAIGWIPRLIIAIYSFAATFILLFKTDPNMAWIALGSAPFLLIMSRIIMRKLREYKKRVLEMNSQMTSFQVETFYNLDTLKSFGVVDQTEKKLKWWQGRYRDFNLDYNKFEIKAKIALSLVSTFVSMVAFGYCLWRLWTGQIQYGDMTFFLHQRSALSSQFKSLAGMLPGMVTSSLSAHRIRELVDLPKERHDPASLEALSRAQGGLTVRMRDVSFVYDEDHPVYERGCFVARPGEIIAVLGPSGEGKTTMLRLLLGLALPTEGSVTIEDGSGYVADMNADLRSLISYVPQGNSVLAGTIAENLRMVRQDATDEELIAALKLACAWEFIEPLPLGFETPVGSRGRGLSEGQAQRIAIARALLRDAPILLMDEATSALDQETEARVLSAIRTARPDGTFIISTHRRSILEQCDRVYFIKERKTQEYTRNKEKE